MKMLLAALSLSALVAGPSFAKPTEAQKEAKDKSKEKTDAKVAGADEKKAHELWVKAGKLDTEAGKAHAAADKAWHQWQSELHRMHVLRAEARHERAEASRLNRAAWKLIQAEHLRGHALDDRLAADQLIRSAHAHELNANAAHAAVTEGQKAEKDLASNPAFADAVKDINADIAKNQAKETAERGAAKADVDVAGKLLADATTLENKAAGLEKPVVVQVKIVVATQKPAPAISAKGK